MDADKQGFLRSHRSLMQVAGRAARHQEGMVILYADKVSAAMDYLISESERRRKIQKAHNEKEGIKPTTIYKSVEDIMSTTAVADSIKDDNYKPIKNRKGDDFSKMDKQLAVDMMRKEMLEAAENLEFEKATKLRDEILKLEKELEGIF